MNTQKLINRALSGLDDLGFQLDSMGITSKVNRHNVIAYVMAEQKHWEGEFDSLVARIDQQRFRVEQMVGRVEGLVRSSAGFALKPVSGLRGLVKA